MSQEALSQILLRFCKTMFENNVSQDMSQDIRKQNTLNKITFKKQRCWDSKL